MAQLFSRRLQLLLKLVVAAGLMCAALAFLLWNSATAWPHPPRETVQQPVPFSHKHHVRDDGLDCRYCHTTVETQASAGMPSISTCMTCHSQLYTDEPPLRPLIAAWTRGQALQWQRVHDLPDFVYFDHGAHVSHAVDCATCHGDIGGMPLTWRESSLTMQWCLDCHRDPDRHLRMPNATVAQLSGRIPSGDDALRAHVGVAAQRLTECSLCHR